jgi:hypothetical protein
VCAVEEISIFQVEPAPGQIFLIQQLPTLVHTGTLCTLGGGNVDLSLPLAHRDDRHGTSGSRGTASGTLG